MDNAWTFFEQVLTRACKIRQQMYLKLYSSVRNMHTHLSLV